MDPGLWRYVAEGGKHVVFAFSGVLAQGDNDDDKGEADKKERVDGYKLSIFEGCVLRISKADLAMAATVDALHEGEENISEEVASIIRVDSEQLNVPPTSEIIDIYERHERSRQYLKQVIQPRVGSQYVDLPRLMRLSLNFSHQLYYRTLQSNVIPLMRLRSWQTKDEKASAKKTTFIHATLLSDHTKMRFTSTRAGYLDEISGGSFWKRLLPILPCISVEIKPKAGYISSSPLIHPSRRCKIYYSRYKINQWLMLNGHVQKGWGSISRDQENLGIVSAYNPLDMFSGNHKRIRRALGYLMDNMQNNLRVWYGGYLLFGHNAQKPDEKMLLSLMNNFIPNFSSFHRSLNLNFSIETCLKGVIADIVSDVLMKEPLLSNILSLQLLDAIDVDGAILVYQRLVQLCSGNNEDAEKFLDNYCQYASFQNHTESQSKEEKGGFEINTTTKENSTNGNSDTGRKSAHGFDGVKMIFKNSPYPLPHTPLLRDLCQKITNFRNYISSCRDTLHDVTILDNSFIDACDCVSRLSQDECLYLLANWLVSLTFCDLSFFVKIQPIQSFLNQIDQLADDESGNFTPRLSESKILSCVIPNKPGLLFASLPSLPSDYQTRVSTVLSDIKVVDYDHKPARKLRCRDDSEKIIEQFSFNQGNHAK